MAMYNGRPVTFIAPVRASHQIEQGVVQYADGTNESVAIYKIEFTQEEKDRLMKDFPSRFANVQVYKTEAKDVKVKK